MTHDDFDALPTADKIAVREKQLKERRDRLDTFSGKAAYFRAMSQQFDSLAVVCARDTVDLTTEIESLRVALRAEKAIVRAAKRKTDAAETPAETPQ